MEIREKIIQTFSLNIKLFNILNPHTNINLITQSTHNNNKIKNKIFKKVQNLGPKYFSSTISTTLNSNLRQKTTFFRTRVLYI